MNFFSQKSCTTFTISIIMVFKFSLAQSNDLWVDSNFDGVVTGGPEAPYRWIQSAADNALPGTTIHIMPGTYRETITLPVDINGTAEAPIRFTAEDGPNTVLIRGTDLITPVADIGGSSYSVSLTDLNLPIWEWDSGRNQIFIDGEMQIWARWPNTSLQDISSPTRENSYDLTVSEYDHIDGAISYALELMEPDLPAKSVDLLGSIVRMTTGKEWFTVDAVVTGYRGKTILTFDIVGLLDFDSYQPVAGNYYYIAGAEALLDAEDEWFIDRNNTLILGRTQLTGDEQVEIKVRENAFDLSGREYITLENLNIFAAGIKTDSASKHITITGLIAEYVNHFERKNNFNDVREVEESHELGIALLGEHHVLRNSRVQYSAGNGITLKGAGHKIINNTILDTNYSGTKTSGIYVLQNSPNANAGMEIAYNTMERSGRNQIHFRDMVNSSIHHNEISHPMLQTSDGGAIYTYGYDNSGTVIAYNLIHDAFAHGLSVPNGVDDYGNPAVTLYNQLAVGIYLDGSGINPALSRNVIVHHNIVWDAMIAMHISPHSIEIEGKTVWGNHQIFNNTFIGDWRGISRVEAAGGLDQVDLRNNLIVGRFSPEEANGGYSVYPKSNYVETKISALSTIGFEDVSKGDFRLKPGENVIKGTGVLHHPYLHDDYQTPGAINAFDNYSNPMFLAGQGASEAMDSRSYIIQANAAGTEIDADWFDTLGGGISFHDDSTGNNGDVTRRPNEWMDSANSQLAWLKPGESINYTVNFSQEGEYDIRLKATNDIASIHIEFFMQSLGSYITSFNFVGQIDSSNEIAGTEDGDWREYEFSYVLPASMLGDNILQLRLNSNSAIDWIKITRANTI